MARLGVPEGWAGKKVRAGERDKVNLWGSNGPEQRESQSGAMTPVGARRETSE